VLILDVIFAILDPLLELYRKHIYWVLSLFFSGKSSFFSPCRTERRISHARIFAHRCTVGFLSIYIRAKHSLNLGSHGANDHSRARLCTVDTRLRECEPLVRRVV